MGSTGNGGAGYLGPKYEPFQHRPRRPAAVRSPSSYLHGRGRQEAGRPVPLRGRRVRGGPQGGAVRQPPHRQGAGVAAAAREGRVRHDARSGRRRRSATATPSSAAAASWRASWSRPACRSSRSGRRTTTATPTTSSATRRTCRCSTRPGRRCSTTWRTAGCCKTRWSSGWARSAARRRSTTAPAATTSSAAGRSCSPAAAIKGGQVYGATDADGKDVKDNPVSEGDLFATIYTALGIDHRDEALRRHPPDLGRRRKGASR